MIACDEGNTQHVTFEYEWLHILPIIPPTFFLYFQTSNAYNNTRKRELLSWKLNGLFLMRNHIYRNSIEWRQLFNKIIILGEIKILGS